MSQHDLNNFQTGNQPEKPLCFIDLFCGCGGFTLGMERSGFRCLAAVDFNLQAVETLKTNLPHIPHVLCRDLTSFTLEELAGHELCILSPELHFVKKISLFF